jgi:glucosamine--fructose-6-phosphate aminotransferase (isomerizing)
MGYVGPKEAAPILLDGLSRLEYRGYDSTGIAIYQTMKSTFTDPKVSSRYFAKKLKMKN